MGEAEPPPKKKKKLKKIGNLAPLVVFGVQRVCDKYSTVMRAAYPLP